MKRVIVILLLVLLVAGGGAGGLIMLGIVPNPFNPKVEIPLSDAEKAAAALSKRKFQPPTSALTRIKVPDMIVPVFSNGRVERRVFITVSLVAAAADKKKTIEDRLLKYQGTVVGDFVPFLQIYFGQHDELDLRIIKEKLVAHAKQIFGDDVRDVLLINVFEQAGNGLQ